MNEVEELRHRIAKLLALVGDYGVCRGCGAAVWWVKHNNGKTAPYTKEALNHFIDCPKANEFRKGGSGGKN